MKNFLSTIALLFCVLVSAQSDFKKGYYINNEGVKTEGYIKYSNFKAINDASFTSLEFKKDVDQEVIKIEKFNITAFGCGKEVKYQKLTALIDDVSFFRDYGIEKNFSLKEKTVFLNVLVEGNATLYSYDNGQGVKYLWKMAGDEGKAKQLLYKRYNKSNLNLTDNNTFREQLFNHVKCPNQTFSDFLKIKYEKDELVSLFKNYNRCTDSPFVIYKEDEEDALKFNFSLLAGYNIGSYRVDNIQQPTVPETFGMFNIGVEGELLFASKKGGLFTSIEFKKAKGSTEQTGRISEFAEPLRQVYDLDASFLDIVFGGRFYKKVNSSISLFAGGGVGLNLGSGTVTSYQASASFPELEKLKTTNLDGGTFFMFQLGCKFSKHYGIDLNYESPKNVLNNIKEVSLVQEFGLNLRYTF